MEIFRYEKAGAGITMYPDRLEMTTGMLWKKQTHTVPLHAIIGMSVQGLGGNTLRIETSGRAYELPVGVGLAAKIRQRILEGLPR